MPAAGRLDRVVTIERHTVVQDEFGQPIETWTAWKQVMMGRRDLRADERFRAPLEQASEVAVWTTHYIDGVTAKDHRLNYHGDIWDVIGVAEMGRRSGLELTATLHVDD